MRRPTPEDFRRFAFVLEDAGRDLIEADAGEAGRDDGMGDRMRRAGILLNGALEVPSRRREGEAAEALRVLAEGVNEWAAHLAGDLVG
jgi:hypothetical protein